MASRSEKSKQDLIKKVCAVVEKSTDKSRVDLACRFVEQMYRSAPPDVLLGTEPERLARAAVNLLDFMQARKPGEALIRVVESTAPPASPGQASPAVLELVNDDMPFLVDSVVAEITRMDKLTTGIVHPVLLVRRAADGTLLDVLDDTVDPQGEDFPEDARYESVMRIRLGEGYNRDDAERIHDNVASVLKDVRLAVEDWRAMRRQSSHLAADFDGPSPGVDVETASEVEAFLRWLHDDHFTFLGYGYFNISQQGKAMQLAANRDAALGLFRKPGFVAFGGGGSEAGILSEIVGSFVSRGPILLINKGDRRSTVHRPAYLDVVIVKDFGDDGKVTGVHMFAGLFTADVYTNSPSFVPILKQKIARVMRRAGFRHAGHDGKRLMNILENLPRDELFESTDDYLYDLSMGILHLQERQTSALFVRVDEFQRYASCLVFLPRERFDTELRLRVGDILCDAFNGRMSNYFTQVTDAPLARIHYIIGLTPGQVPEVTMDKVETAIATAARAWSDQLLESLVKTHGEDDARKIFAHYGHAFPSAYRETFDTDTAVADIDRIQEVLDGKRRLGMYLSDGGLGDNNGFVRFSVYHAAEPVHLSNVLPLLENMGFHVRGEVPFLVTPRGSASRSGGVWMHDFSVNAGEEVDVEAVRETFHEAFEKAWSGEMENDGFNKLVISAGLSWRQVVILRAYAKFLKQAAFGFSQSYIEETLHANPKITRTLIDLFETEFALKVAKRADRTKALKEQVIEMLEGVASADQDRILRRYLNLIDCTLRTNFYQPAADGSPKSYVSFKLDSRRVEDLPLPRPMVEIFVYSPRVEAVHLRGGKVARGGLRWSDRREDFRSEILGLVKAQVVKNAVIVPTGSKGGFVVKQPPTEGGRDAFIEEGIACYKIMQSGLLDITDNLVDNKVAPPKNVVRRDEDDPYLVVAADKGTATFSDIANGVSEAYGFWLGDAFASGGSVGYDHKAMGITAKGAWESVKRHFREMGKDIQKEEFTAIGVGDMSGDVFGNGMLLSKCTRLKAAFNHMHIFVDPHPDAAASFKERQRLFKKARSTWLDYNAKLISKGGGIFERSAKRLTLTPEIQKAFGIAEKTVTPDDLIKAILKSEIDLLWFGGIGTYIKAKSESHADVKDRANDAIRINGGEVRAQVIGEGANLGCTQLGRIEAAHNGRRLNTDAIDNSAGVDCSDHEVNIKILLNTLVAAGKLSMKKRNEMLVEMTDEVSALVLRDNYLQTQALSLLSLDPVRHLEAQVRFMRMRERAGALDRTIEFLPTDEELGERGAKGIGLTRPELAVVEPYGKIWLYDQIIKSDLPDDPYLERDLIDYFPTLLREKYKKPILEHKLRREIIATVITNEIVNRLGSSTVAQAAEVSGRSPADVARAFIIVREIYALGDIWGRVEALDNKVPAHVQLRMLDEVNVMIDRAVLWLLREDMGMDSVEKTIGRTGAGIAALRANFLKVIGDDVQARFKQECTRLTAADVPAGLAADVAMSRFLPMGINMVRFAEDSGLDVPGVARIYYSIGARFRLPHLRATAYAYKTTSHWEARAISALIDDLFSSQMGLVRAVLVDVKAGEKNAPAAALGRWEKEHETVLTRTEAVMADILANDPVDLAMIAVASRQLSSLVKA